MILNRQMLGKNITKSFSEEVDFSNLEFSLQHVKAIKDCFVELDAVQFDDLLRVKIKVKATVIGVCSYTLEDVVLHVKGDDELNFTDFESDDSFYEPNQSMIAKKIEEAKKQYEW